MYKKLLLGAFLLLSNISFAQSPTPGTFPPIPSEVAYIQNTIIPLESGLIDTIYRVPVQSYIITNTTNQGLSLSQLNRGFGLLNKYFEGTNIQFYLVEPIYIQNLLWYDFNRFSEETNLISEYFSDSTINLYCFNTVQDFDNNNVWGYTYFPSDELKNQIFIRNDAVEEGRELTRLFGQYFGLLNTSETVIAQEKADSTNCTVSGDLICDTPADPGSTLIVNSNSCTHNGSTLQDTEGTPYSNVPINNIMSLHATVCNKTFTLQQKNRLRAGVQDRINKSSFKVNVPEVLLPSALMGKNYGRYTTLRWTDIADNELGYWVERSTNRNEGYTIIGGLSANSTVYLDTTVNLNTTYYYRITPANSNFQYSEVLEVIPQNSYCSPLYTDACNTAYFKKVEITTAQILDEEDECTVSHYRTKDLSEVTLNSGTSYSFTIDLQETGQNISIWLDKNQDGLFTLSERIFISNNSQIGMYSEVFSIPIDAKGGITLLRIRTNKAVEGDVNSPCDAYEGGETRDFWLNITGNENSCVAFDKAILSIIYEELNGENWTNSQNWNSETDLRNWFGVGVNNQGCVSNLSLSFNNVSGNIPEELFLLSSLENVSLSNNNITGEISENVSKLRNLAFLDLSDNQVVGNIPSELSQINTLRVIRIKNNNLEGNIPISLNKLSLSGLDISNNQFVSIPDFSSNTRWNEGSTGFEVQNNRLSFDDILPHINIQEFRFRFQNSFNTIDTININHGTPYIIDLGIDSTLSTNIYRWKLDNQTLKETNVNKLKIDSTLIPGLYKYEVEVSNPQVENFQLNAEPIYVNILPTDSTALVAFYNNTNGESWKVKWDLTQPINTWSGLSFNSDGRVRRINLVDNNIEGALPEEFIYLTELTDLRLAKNKLIGNLDMLGNLNKLNIIWLYENQFEGNLPSSFSELTNLEELQINDNMFSGNIPEEWNNLVNLKTLIISNNKLEGSVPNSFSNLQRLETFRLENNNLNDLANLSSITTWELFTFTGLQVQGNRMSFEDIIPNLSVTNFIYSPQDTIGRDEQFTLSEGASYTIDLNIDDSLTTNVYTWYRDNELFTIADTNKLTVNEIGIYRCEVTNPQVSTLKLSSYPVTISIPSVDSIHLVRFFEKTNGNNWIRPWDISQPISTWEGVTINRLGRVTKLNLPRNNIQGNISSDIGFITELEELDLSGNSLKNIEPGVIDLKKIKVLDISFNAFEGEFPEEISELTSIEFLNLQANRLNGKITDVLTKLDNLFTLNISDNKIEGLPNLNNVGNLSLNANGGIRIQNNRLTFSDIISSINIPNLTYLPQEEIGEEQKLELGEAGEYTIDLKIDNPDLNNQYQWFRNDELLETPSNQATLTVTKSGIYSAKVTNPQVPDLILNSNSIIIQNATQDSLALVALYQSTNGQNWLNPWDLELSMENWEGVTLDQSRSVESLLLNNQNLSGEIPNEIGNLQSVIKIDFSNNNLQNILPSAISNLITLQSLDLSNNNLRGGLPQSLANLLQLETLKLNGNSLTDIPVMSPTNPWSQENSEGFQVQDNLLTFESLLKNKDVPNFTYSPQALIGEEQLLTAFIDKPAKISINIDNNVQNNLYRWLKNGALFFQSDTNRLDISEDGIFTVEVLNGELPDLALRSKVYTVQRYLGPEQLKSVSDSYRSVELEWNDVDETEQGFNIERALKSDGIYESVATTEANITVYKDINLLDNEEYIYRVQSIRNEGKSYYSNITESKTPDINFNSDKNSINVGNTVNFSFTSSILPDTVFWSFGGNAIPSVTSEFFPEVTYTNGEGTYNVILEAVSDKGDTATIIKENYIEVICPDVTPVILVDRFILISTFAQSYKWFLNGEELEETTQQITALEAGEYQVQIMDSLGCVGISEPVQITVTSLDNNDFQSAINIYPNPSKGKFHVVLPNQKGIAPNIEVYTLDGKREEIQTVFLNKDKSWETEIDLSDHSKGVYLLYINIGSEIATRKIVLE